MRYSLPLFDLHCDTLYEATRRDCSLNENSLHISLSRLREYRRATQVLAVWSSPRESEDENFAFFTRARAKLDSELAEARDFRLVTSERELAECEKSDVNSLFLAVEGGRLLGDDLTRLDTLYASGVRFLTLVWDGICRLGGAHDSDVGLTDFGRKVVARCFELGIIPDVSHASLEMTSEVIELARESGKVCIATHSNSRAVREHRRNLTDEHFREISKLGGIVGVSLATMHLTGGEKCTLDDIVRHIEHYLSLGGEDTICLGCDLDGIEKLPEELENVSDIAKIAEKLAQINYTDALIEKIFYANARNFISLWL